MFLKRISFFSLLMLLGVIMQSHLMATDSESVNKLRAFMNQYQADFHKMHCDMSYSWWDAMITGDKKAFEKSAEATLAMSTYHSSADRYKTLKDLIAKCGKVSPIEDRAAHVACRSFEESQLPPDLMKKMIDLSNEIEQVFQTQRCVIDGKQYTNNDLLEMLEDELDSQRRFQIWAALKEVGELVAPRLIKLAKLRNEAAKHLGYNNYWEMTVSFQDYDPRELTTIFDELVTLTTPLFKEMKEELDGELKEKFNVAKIMPWHYDNPFFQQAPPSKKVDVNEFYEKFKKEDIVDISIKYYDSIGLDVRPIIKNSDLFEKEGKSQHGFCNNMNGEGDIRILCNIKPTAEWMDTQLHELGHSVYDYMVDRSLPYNLREAAHIFTTEGIAMMFGALARDPDWLVQNAGVKPERAKEVSAALAQQRLREQLIFCRWTLVMFYFEKALYENPDQNLNDLWWDIVEKYQMMPRPENRHVADWASKPHFVIAPVYYHNYMLGELFGAQVRKACQKNVPKNDPKALGSFLVEKVFKPGNSYPWEEFVIKATGEPFSARAYADELNKAAKKK